MFLEIKHKNLDYKDNLIHGLRRTQWNSKPCKAQWGLFSRHSLFSSSSTPERFCAETCSNLSIASPGEGE